MLEMAHNFKAQQNGMMMQQPIPDGQVDSNNQPLHDCFEVYVTRSWRQKYDEIFTKASQRLRNRKSTTGGEQASGKRFFGGKLQQVPPDQLLKAYRRLNRFLRHFINKTSREHKREMRQNTFQNRLLRIPPELTSADTSVVFGDSSFRFRRVLFLGEEYNLLVFNIL